MKREIPGFINARHYRGIAHREENPPRYLISIRTMMEPPLARWAAIIGDAVHNARSALDLLACQLVVANNGTVTNRTSFPIKRKVPVSRQEWKDFVANKVDGAESRAIAIFHEMQPYPTGDGEAFWRLHEMDIADKHHLLMPVAGTVPDSDATIRITMRSGTVETLSLRIAQIFPLKSETPILSLPISADTASVNVNFNDSLRIAFGQPKAVSRLAIVPTLREILEFVDRAFNVFVPFLR